MKPFFWCFTPRDKNVNYKPSNESDKVAEMIAHATLNFGGNFLKGRNAVKLNHPSEEIIFHLIKHASDHTQSGVLIVFHFTADPLKYNWSCCS